MQKQEHSYLDLSVLPEVRANIISADAAVLFRHDLSDILWANANGAKLFGGRGVEDLLKAKLSSEQAIIKQLDASIRQLSSKKTISRGFRINQGSHSVVLQFDIKRIELPNNDHGYLVTNAASPDHTSNENELCEAAILSLDGFADAAAILDDYGLSIFASSGFADLAPSEEILSELVAELQSENDRLIKRPVERITGKTVIIGMARFQDDPGRNLIVLAETEEHIDEESSQDANVVAETPEASKEVFTDEVLEQTTSSTAIEAHEDENENLFSKDDAAEEITLHASEQLENENTEEPVDNATIGENFLYLNEKDDVRFAWSIDENSIFQSVSPELSKTVGPNAADIIGRSWADISTVFGFDKSGDIAANFAKQDTWSGKTVLWPVQGTDMVLPVDLAALPAFGQNREFNGFKGFGIIRTVDAIVDPEAIGLALVGVSNEQVKNSKSLEDELNSEQEPSDDSLNLGVADEGESDLAFLNSVSEEETEKPSDETNVVHLVPKSLQPPTTTLSEKENSAFEVIGEKLMDASGNENQKSHSHLDTSLMENLPVAILVYKTDELLFANDRMLKISGYENLESLTAAGGIEGILNTGDGSETDGSGKQYLTTQSGNKIPIEPVLHTVPWQGEKALLLSFATKDNLVFEQPLALEISASSEIQNILDTASDGIVLLENDGNIISINSSAEALFGISYDEASDQPLTELFAPESKEIVSDYLESLSAPGVEQLLNDGRDVIAQEKNGGLIPIFLTISRMESSNKLCAVIRDMTSWKKVEEELIQSRREAIKASEQKTDFLAHVSHEIRTPLNAIIGFSDVMLEEKFGPIDNERYREYLRDINRSGSHVLELVNDLLDLSKIEAGKLELSFEAVELNQLVAETVALLQPQANNNRIIIRTSLSRAVPKVVADPRSIRQIILNLVSNAIKFSPANSQVIVSTIYETNGEVALRVRDTGDGMTDREIKEAMKPFHQLHSVSERKGEGSGLGLPLTKALVEANRALFELESEPGVGTIAHVQFPNQRVLTD